MPGEYDSTAELIDKAVTALGRKLKEQQQEQQDHLTSRLEELESRIVNTVNDRMRAALSV